MAWYRSHKKDSSSAPDGNNILYPVQDPSSSNKLYKESDVNAIAVAIGGGSYKIADMASAISGGGGGLDATKVTIIYADYTVV